MDAYEELSGPPPRAVVAVAAFVAIQLKVATFAGGLALWRSTRGDFTATFSRELTYLIFTAVLLPLGALSVARRPPTLAAPLASAARMLALAGAALAIQYAVFYQLMVRIGGYSPRAAHPILLGAIPRNLNGWLVLLCLAALVIYGLRADEERARQDRIRADLDRELAARAAATIRRSVHPRFLAARLGDVARAIAGAGDAEPLVYRIARYVRLLQRERGDTTRLFTELNLLGTMARMSSLRFDVELPRELRDVQVAKGLTAAFADLATRESTERRFRVVAAASPDGDVTVRITVSEAGGGVAAKLRELLEKDAGLTRTATVAQQPDGLAVTYRPVPASEQPVPPDPPPPRRLSGWIPIAIVLVVSIRVFFVASGDPTLNGTRKLAVLLWLAGAAPLLAAIVARIRASFVTGLVAASGIATLFAAAVAVASLELFALIAGVPAVLLAGDSPWLALPRDSATIGTAVALSALLGNYVMRIEEERARSIRLETLLSRADVGAVEARFHPHFLFNSLNAVLALLQEEPAAAETMASRLAALFEDVVTGDDLQEWPLGRERAVTERYLDVMRIRFGDRLRVEWRIPRHLERVLVPRLILQPLVENAIKHGIAARTAPGTVAVSVAHTHRGELRLTVENDTATPATLPPVQRGGLSYTSQRLSLLYGPGSAPRFSADARQFRVEITIPGRPLTS